MVLGKKNQDIWLSHVRGEGDKTQPHIRSINTMVKNGPLWCIAFFLKFTSNWQICLCCGNLLLSLQALIYVTDNFVHLLWWFTKHIITNFVCLTQATGSERQTCLLCTDNLVIIFSLDYGSLASKAHSNYYLQWLREVQPVNSTVWFQAIFYITIKKSVVK